MSNGHTIIIKRLGLLALAIALEAPAAAQTGGSLAAQFLKVKEAAANGTATVTIQKPSLTTSYTLTLPDDDGASGDLLTTDGSGALSWTKSLTTGFTLDTPTVRTALLLQNASGAMPQLRLSEDPDNGTNYVAIQAPASIADYTLTLPDDDGDSGETLTTNGSGVLSWTAALVNPMDSDGDMIYGGSGGAATKLDHGTAGTLLMANGAAAPTWVDTITGNKTFSSGNVTVEGDLIPSASNALIRKATSDGADNRNICLVGGGACSNTRGAYVITYGNEAANTGDLEMSAGNVAGGDILLATGGSTRFIVSNAGQMEAVTGSASAPSYSIDGDENTGWYSSGSEEFAITTNGTTDVRFAGDMFYVKNGFTIRAATSDGSDNDNVAIGGGGDSSQGRGGFIQLFGNQVGSSNGGRVTIAAGAAAEGDNAIIAFQTSGSNRMNIAENGAVTIDDTGGNGGNVVHGCTRRTNTSSSSVTVTVDCSAGERLTGGGCKAGVGNMIDNFPADDDTWECEFTSSSSSHIAYAICCDY